jgi:hypothetical protein
LNSIFLNILKKMLKLLFGSVKYAGYCGFILSALMLKL